MTARQPADRLKSDPRRVRVVNGRRPGPLGPLLAIALLAALGVAAIGAWPPLVAVESGSMAPGVERGDMVVVAAPDRVPWGDGVVGSAEADAPERFESAGDVVVFSSPDAPNRPILHRVAFAVTAGEDWTERADPARLDAECADLRSCPAAHDGYVTYGDANDAYDQSAGIAPVVREEWIHAKAVASIPSVGYLRIGVDAAAERFGPIPVWIGLVSGLAGLGGLGAILLERIRNGTKQRARSESGERSGPDE